ncbi:uncharacterized protein LOC144955610 isoform X3 [Lampetra fluviatilis]
MGKALLQPASRRPERPKMAEMDPLSSMLAEMKTSSPFLLRRMRAAEVGGDDPSVLRSTEVTATHSPIPPWAAPPLKPGGGATSPPTAPPTASRQFPSHDPAPRSVSPFRALANSGQQQKAPAPTPAPFLTSPAPFRAPDPPAPAPFRAPDPPAPAPFRAPIPAPTPAPFLTSLAPVRAPDPTPFRAPIPAPTPAPFLTSPAPVRAPDPPAPTPFRAPATPAPATPAPIQIPAQSLAQAQTAIRGFVGAAQSGASESGARTPGQVSGKTWASSTAPAPAPTLAAPAQVSGKTWVSSTASAAPAPAPALAAPGQVSGKTWVSSAAPTPAPVGAPGQVSGKTWASSTASPPPGYSSSSNPAPAPAPPAPAPAPAPAPPAPAPAPPAPALALHSGVYRPPAPSVGGGNSAKGVTPPPAQPSQSQPSAETHKEPMGQLAEGLCTGCGLSLDGRQCEFSGQRFHLGCFVCSVCHCGLHDREFYARRDCYYCDGCYLAQLEVCVACGELVRERVVRAGEFPFHPQCLLCSECGSSLLSQPLAMAPGSESSELGTKPRPLCLPDYHR